MRTEPLIKKEPDKELITTQVLRYVAILVAFVSVFAFYLKLLFL
jgi:hypothetical protein